MFEADSLSAHRFMRPETICLTFDDGPGDTDGDGPGPKTLRLAKYLNAENIIATFFCVGKHIIKYPDVVKEAASLGHIIGNHTFCHCDHLPILLSKGWDVASEILMTDELIKEYNPNGTIYFRAPWGAWSQDVAYNLNKKVKNSLKHVGLIFWDM
jgi:peptidoglycan-N-acetylglucosamine deacetylase